MRNIQWNISAGALLIFALAYFFDENGLVAAAVPAAAIHELGHVAALTAFHCRVTRIGIGAFGLEMDYAGVLGERELIITAAAGPVSGALYAVAAANLPQPYFRLSGAVSLCLSAFNLLPILPLDGGRIVAALTDTRFAANLSKIAAAVLLLGGVGLFAGFRSFPLLCMGAWLLFSNFR